MAALAGIFVLAALLAPLALRGPRLIWAVERLVPPLRGEIRLGGGGLGAGAVFAGILGLPVPLHLKDFAVFDPEGVEVFWAADLRAALVLERRPLRLVIHDLRPGLSRWRLALMRRYPALGFAAAFMPAAGSIPAPPRMVEGPIPAERVPRPPAPAVAPRFQLAIASAHLDGTSAVFDFPGWGLELGNIRAEGSLWAAMPSGGRPPLGFEVRAIDARGGGSLRILGGRYGSRVPFDRARLDWIGTPAHSPADLLLLVAGALTGESRLSGRALFAGLFAGRRADVRRGMEIDASWERAGDALTAVAADRGLRGLEVRGAEARLRARVRGSFRQMESRFEAEGFDVTYAGSRLDDLTLNVELGAPPARLKLERLSFRSPSGGIVEASGGLEPGGSARFRLRLEQLATRALLPPPLRPLLGGTAQGWIAARGDLSLRPRTSPLRDARFVLQGMDLTLTRAEPGPLPRRVRLFAGKVVAGGGAPDPDLLLGSVEGVRYERGTLTVQGAAAAFAGAQLTASARIHTESPAGEALSSPRLQASLRARRVDLARVLPGIGLTGALTFGAQASGAFDNLAAHIRFTRPSTVMIFDQPYGLPPRIDLTLRGDLLTLPRFALAPPGGGRLVAGGQVVLDREVELTLGIDGHRLETLPWISRRLGGARGVLHGKMRLQGRPGRATLTGEASLEASHLPLDRLLPPLPPGARIGPRPESGLRLAGGFRLAVAGRKPFALEADLRTLQLDYGCSTLPPANPGSCLRFETTAPVRIQSLGGLEQVELHRAHLRSKESDFSVAGRLTGGNLDARLDGRFGVALFEPLHRRWPLVFSSGAIEAALEARGPAGAPRVGGTLRVVEPVVVRGRMSSSTLGHSRGPGPPAMVALGRLHLRLEQGMVRFGEGRMQGSGLELVGHGLRLRLAGEGPIAAGDRGTPLGLSVEGEIDAAELARSFPEVVRQARGTLRLDARLAGSLAEPVLDGRLEFGPLAASLRQNEIQVSVHPGRLELRRNRLTVAGLTIDVTPGGRLTLGPPGRPGMIEIEKLVPVVLGEVRIPAVGRGLHLALPWLTIDEGSFELTLDGNASQALRLRGRMDLGTGRYWPGRQPRPGTSTATARVTRRLPRSLQPAMLPVTLDLQLVGNADRFVIDPGWLPDLHFGLDVRIGGTLTRPRVIWEAAPRGLYSRFVFLLYRLFT
jgi:hypothetical protein